MARLDWKNVENPDFNSAARLQQVANSSLDSALAGVGTFADGVANRNNAQNQKALELAKIKYLNDPSGLREAVAGGQFDSLFRARGITGQDIAGTRTAADDYLSSLQGFRTDGRNEDLRARRDAARPDMVSSILAQHRGDHAESDRIVQGSDAIRNLDFNDVDGLIGDVTAGGQAYRTESNSRKSFAEDRMVEQFLASLDYNNMSAESKLLDLDAAYNNGNSRMPAGVYNRVKSTLLGSAPTTSGGMGGIAAPATGGFLGSGTNAPLGSMPTGTMQAEDYFSDDLTPFETGLFNTEASNNPSAKNKNSSAEGLGQFTSDTFLGVIKKYHPEIAKGKSDEEIKALRTDPEIMKRASISLRKENAAALQRAGIPLNEETMYLAHHFNPERAAEIYRKRSPNILMEDLLTPKELKANGVYRGKTYGEVSSRWARNFAAGRAATPAQAVAQGQLVNDDAHSASAAAAGDNRSYLDLQADKRSYADVVTDEVKEGGRLSGMDRGVVNDAMRRIKDLVPKIEGANGEDVKVSDWKPTDAQLMDILVSSMSGNENRFSLGSLAYPAAYAIHSFIPNKFRSKVGLGDSKDSGKVGSIPLDLSEAQRLVNLRYSSVSDAGAQTAREIDMGIAKREQLRTKVAQLEASVSAMARSANTPGKQREVARAKAILAEKVAQLEAANAAGRSAPVKQDQAAAVRADTEREKEMREANEARAARMFPNRPRGPRSNMSDEQRARMEYELLRDHRNF